MSRLPPHLHQLRICCHYVTTSVLCPAAKYICCLCYSTMQYVLLVILACATSIQLPVAYMNVTPTMLNTTTICRTLGPRPLGTGACSTATPHPKGAGRQLPQYLGASTYAQHVIA